MGNQDGLTQAAFERSGGVAGISPDASGQYLDTLLVVINLPTPITANDVQLNAIGGIAAGFAFFVLAEVSRNFAMAGLTSAMAAAWVPIIISASLASLTSRVATSPPIACG